VPKQTQTEVKSSLTTKPHRTFHQRSRAFYRCVGCTCHACSPWFNELEMKFEY